MGAPDREDYAAVSYSVADVDRLTAQAGSLLDQLRVVLAEIGDRMTALTVKDEQGR